jgi:hypothetical protein
MAYGDDGYGDDYYGGDGDDEEDVVDPEPEPDAEVTELIDPITPGPWRRRG